MTGLIMGIFKFNPLRMSKIAIVATRKGWLFSYYFEWKG
jgi:hypothetical protein